MIAGLSTKNKIRLQQVLWIGTVWAIFGFLDTVITWGIAHSHYLHPNENYHFRFDLIYTCTSLFFGGLVGGALTLFVLRDRWKKQPFWVYFLNSSLTILVLYFILSWLSYLHRFMFELKKPLWSQEVWDAAAHYFFGPPNLSNTIIIMTLTAGTILWVRINDRYGQGNLLSSFLGKYHHPIEEERIFMFLDIKSSTTIAERLGRLRFHQFLDDFFRDISDPILYSKGQVYQYVGDEVVISWTVPKGVKKAHCIQCFYDIRKAIEKAAPYYRKNFDGIVPEFKAGLHLGKVATGEIGEIKRELVHSGDVLNTAARIQEKCNELKVKILLSNDLLERMTLLPAHCEVKEMGTYALRGKSENIELFTLVERSRHRGFIMEKRNASPER
jgi:adenylate cyclase